MLCSALCRRFVKLGCLRSTEEAGERKFAFRVKVSAWIYMLSLCFIFSTLVTFMFAHWNYLN